MHTFQKSWQKEFEWLDWNSDKQRMLCKFCIAYPQYANSAFATEGCGTIKRETILKHCKSKSHIYCRDIYLNKHAEHAQQRVIPQVFARHQTAQQAEIQRSLEIKFNIAYTIAKEELPFTKFRPLLLLHKKNGVEINPTYDNDVKCAEFISVICDTMKLELRDLLESAGYMSIIIDGDTDISVKECEIVYVRVLENGKPVNKLLGQQEVAHAHAAGNLFFAVLHKMEKYIWVHRFMATLKHYKPSSIRCSSCR